MVSMVGIIILENCTLKLKCILIVIFIVLDVSQIRAVEIKKICYVWCDIQGKFQKLVGLDRGLTTAQLHTYKGYTVQEQLIRYYIVYKRYYISHNNITFKLMLIYEITENAFMEKTKSMYLFKI